ncbi:RabGAP/TBC [Coprinopsis marcescibilis]|uniref:RabGAP/TBC n=1 Tax=Coprinopsis marcescibilis TaxID=230819 RepID=A0A5C3L243_COPMA|nr:RabGAP/TBC [Coprinopsis marcescibilis]
MQDEQRRKLRSTPPPPSLPTPPVNFSPALKSHPSNVSLNPSLVPSLVPSFGEEFDAFHVRNTYAQLEVFGVKGDGYEDGVERTRAARTRLPSSIANSPNTSTNGTGDGSPKKRELHPKEIQILSSVDRYGFFTIPSHDRLILMPSQPMLKPLSTGSGADAPVAGELKSPRSLPRVPPPLPHPKEAERISKWNRMLVPNVRDEGGNVQAWRVRPSKTAKVRRRVYKGVPDRWRAAVWEVLMCAYAERLSRDYREAIEKPSTYDVQIDLDVPRTISGHIMFRTRYGAGQRSLFHVLHAFSLLCDACGYVQGMGPIAATLLSYLPPSLAYTSLVRLHTAYDMHTIFSPGFPGLLEAIYVQEQITKRCMPNVYESFKKHMVSTTAYATKWYITLFSNTVPFQTQLRLWDVFWLEGLDVFVAVAVAVLWVYKDQITSPHANFETILSLLSSFFVPEDEDVFLNWIEKMLGDRKLRASIRTWRLEWRQLVQSGQDATALL